MKSQNRSEKIEMKLSRKHTQKQKQTQANIRARPRHKQKTMYGANIRAEGKETTMTRTQPATQIKSCMKRKQQ
jgi:hypothetical protein